MKDLVIVGAGGFGTEVAWLIERINSDTPKWNVLGFVDDDQSIQSSEVNGYKVLGNVDWLKHQNLQVVTAIANPIIKEKVIEKLEGSNNQYPVLIDPSVIYSKSVLFGEGAIVCAGAIMTVNIEIGKHVIVSVDSTIGHDTSIGDYATILPNVSVSGLVKIEEFVSIGTESSIIQGLSIGEKTIVGAGAVVIKDLPSNCTAVGSPAKPIKFHK